MGTSSGFLFRDHCDQRSEPSFSTVVLCDPIGRPIRLCASVFEYRWSMLRSADESLLCDHEIGGVSRTEMALRTRTLCRAEFKGVLKRDRIGTDHISPEV